MFSLTSELNFEIRLLFRRSSGFKGLDCVEMFSKREDLSPLSE
jgi:hypothetical protein